MSINLNKKLVSKEGILSYIQDIDIYRFYTKQEVDLTKNIKSPLRDDDDNPSFGYFYGESGEICFNDFGKNTGDCIKFVQLYFGLSFFEALSKIAIDFNLTAHFIYKDVFKTSRDFDISKLSDRDKILSSAIKKTVGKRARKFKLHDLMYWEEHGITKSTLKHYRVEPVDYIFFDGHPILADKYAYCYTEFKDNKKTYKIYQPFSENYKWSGNHNDSIWQGWTQLPMEGQELIITSSLKDAMAIVDVLKIPSVALQSESVTPKPHVVEQLQKRFKRIIILYDNDFDKEENIGQLQSDKLAKQFGFTQYTIPERYKVKDFSDLVKNYGREKAYEIFKTSIEMPF